MQTLEITYVYRNSEEKRLESLLVNLETEIGGSRNPFYGRAGAIDIVSFLELAVTFIAGAAAKPPGLIMKGGFPAEKRVLDFLIAFEAFTNSLPTDGLDGLFRRQILLVVVWIDIDAIGNIASQLPLDLPTKPLGIFGV